MKAFALTTIFLISSIAIANDSPLATVDSVDVDRYLGKWYEIASFPQRFQKGCTATEANYSIREDGDIRVLNRCRLNTPDGELKEAKGRAWVVNEETNAQLKVQFFLSDIQLPFLAGNYWILHLDEDYSVALVGEPSRQYLWILSRDKKISDDIYDQLVNKAKSLAFDITKLVKTIH